MWIQLIFPRMYNLSNVLPTVKRKHFVCVNFNGRLGNHLFQFASSYGIAKYKNMDVVINSKSYLLRGFNLQVDILKDTSMYIPPKVRVIKERQTSAFDRNMMEFDNEYDVLLRKQLASYYYFKKYENELRKQLTFKTEIRKEAVFILDSYLKRFRVTRISHAFGKTSKCIYLQHGKKVTLIGVHVRRGDWLTDGHRVVATKEYLHRAVALYKTMYDNILFIVISNGMFWTKTNMPKDINVIYVETNSVWPDLAGVNLSEHFISTVGTFSWWAGWLTGGNVTYFKWPARRGSPFRVMFSKDFKDYFYPNWIGL